MDKIKHVILKSHLSPSGRTQAKHQRTNTSKTPPNERKQNKQQAQVDERKQSTSGHTQTKRHRTSKQTAQTNASKTNNSGQTRAKHHRMNAIKTNNKPKRTNASKISFFNICMLKVFQSLPFSYSYYFHYQFLHVLPFFPFCFFLGDYEPAHILKPYSAGRTTLHATLNACTQH